MTSARNYAGRKPCTVRQPKTGDFVLEIDVSWLQRQGYTSTGRCATSACAFRSRPLLMSQPIRWLMVFLILALAAPTAWGAETPPPIGPPPGDLHPKPGEHSLDPLIRWGKASLPKLRALRDYECRMIRREFVGGRLRPHEQFTLKVRHEPLSFYTGKLNRAGKLVEEAIYVEGQNDGMVMAHTDRYRFMGTMSLYPDSRRIMRDNRHPITSAGLVSLVEQLISGAEADMRLGACDVKVYDDAKIESRTCIALVASHQEQEEGQWFKEVRVFIDRELNVPVRYELYGWPNTPGDKPVPLEEYTFLDLRVNQGLADRDFDVANSAYAFPPLFEAPSVSFASDASQTGRRFAPIDDAHPLRPVLEMLERSTERLAQADDYTALYTKRERIDGRLADHEYMMLKVRQVPFSLYVNCLGPTLPRGQEVIFVEGRNAGQLLVHRGDRSAAQPQLLVPPTAPAAMAGGRSFAELGLRRLADSMSTLLMHETKFAECDVYYMAGARIDNRRATCVVISHPRPRRSFRYHQMRLYFDDDLGLCTRLETFAWPAKVGGAPALQEEHTFRQIRLDTGTSEDDFDPRNPDYGFLTAANP